MVLEPPQHDPVSALPPVTDRRAPERRSYERRAEERTQLSRVLAPAAVALCGGLFVLFVFFWALGAIDVTDAVAATAVAIVLALVWLGALLYRRAQEEPLLIRRDRERRGF